MILKKLTTNMMVENVNETLDFYRDILGFEFVMAVPENSQDILIEGPDGRTLAYGMMKHGSVEIMFQKRSSLCEDFPEFDEMKVGGTLTFYIEVEDIDTLYGELKERVVMVRELHTTFYGMREFYFKDCNGYILGFTQNG